MPPLQTPSKYTFNGYRVLEETNYLNPMTTYCQGIEPGAYQIKPTKSLDTESGR